MSSMNSNRLLTIDAYSRVSQSGALMAAFVGVLPGLSTLFSLQYFQWVLVSFWCIGSRGGQYSTARDKGPSSKAIKKYQRISVCVLRLPKQPDT
jgi:hypothetical protein